jgi:tyrosinase
MPTRGNGTRTIDPRKPSTKETPLAPFNASETKSDYWTSEGIRDTKTFGYVYPETRDWLFPTTEAINVELDRIYKLNSLASTLLADGPDFKELVGELESRARLHQKVTETSLDMHAMIKAVESNQADLPQEIAQQAAALKLPADRKLEDLVTENKYLEWLVDIKAEKHANNGDFVVHVFLDDPEDIEPKLYIFNPNHVATFSTFGQGGENGCEKCKTDEAARLEVTGQIPLTLALVERYLSGQVNGLDVTSVEEYLQRNLHWRVTSRKGEAIPRSQIESLLIGVVTNEVTLPIGGVGRPQYSPNIVPRPAVTTRQNGDPRGDGTGYIGGEIPTVAA